MTERQDIFATTRWSVVVAAGGERSKRALEELCGTYWYPLYAYVRRRGHSREDAEDLTQSFLARILGSSDLAAPGYWLRAFSRVPPGVAEAFPDERMGPRTPAEARGSRHALLDRLGDGRFAIPTGGRIRRRPGARLRPEWALALLERVIHALRAECVADDRAALFEELKVFLTVGHAEASVADAAANLAMTPGSVRVAVHRLRRRYRGLLRREVAQTMATGASVEEEMRTLFAAFRA